MIPSDLNALLEDLDLEMMEEFEDEIRARCPMHIARLGVVDRNPSWSINRETGLHHCWSCEYGGNLTSLVMGIRNCSMLQARRIIRKYGISFDKLLDAFAPEFDGDDEPRPDLSGLPLYERFEHFTRPPARALMDRGKVNGKLVHSGLERWSCELYGIRWNPDRWSWIIPWHNDLGDFMGWQEKGSDFYKTFPRGLRRGDSLFGLTHMSGNEEFVLLVESPLDVVYLAQHQYDGLAIAGSNFTLKAQQVLMQRVDREIVVALDNDDSGRKLSRELKFRLGRRCNVSFFNYTGLKGKDVGELTGADIEEGIDNRVHSLWY